MQLFAAEGDHAGAMLKALGVPNDMATEHEPRGEVQEGNNSTDRMDDRNSSIDTGTNSDPLDLQEKELIERFNTDSTKQGATQAPGVFMPPWPLNLQTSLLYPNLQAVGHPHPVQGGVPGNAMGSMAGMGMPSYGFPNQVLHKPFSQPQPHPHYPIHFNPPDCFGYYPLPEQYNHPLDPTFGAQVPSMLPCNFFQSNVPVPEMWSVPSQNVYPPFLQPSPLPRINVNTSATMSILPPMRKPALSLNKMTVSQAPKQIHITISDKPTNYTHMSVASVSDAGSETNSPNINITVNTNANNGAKHAIMSPMQIPKYVLALLDHNVSTSSAALKELQSLLNPHHNLSDACYIELYNAAVENLVLLTKSNQGAQFLEMLVPRLKGRRMYSDFISALFGHLRVFIGHQHATKLLQSILDDLSDDHFLEFCNKIEPDCMVYCHHRQGNHIIQKVITLLEAKVFVNERYREVADRFTTVILANPRDFLELSVQVCGCRIYQKLFPLIIEESMLANIRDTLLDKFTFLCNNQWANFCIQGLLKNKMFFYFDIRKSIVELLIRNAVTLCKHKFGSHVVEHFLSSCPVREQVDFSMSLFMSPQFPTLMDDLYGNFIVQRMLRSKATGSDPRLNTLRETCGRLCKYYLKNYAFRDESIKNITHYLNKYMKELRTLDPLPPDKLLEIAKKLDVSVQFECA